MTDLETLLADRLEVRADRVPVGPAPVDLMLRQATVRRRRPFVVLAAAAAVALVAMGVAVVVPGSESGSAPSPSAPMPDGVQTIGEGRVVVDVPGRITDEEASVRVLVGPDRDLSPIPAFRGGADDVVIDGVPAVRYPATCDQSQQECRTWVAVPGEDTVVVVESHLGAGLAHDLATRVRVLRDVPSGTKRVGIGHLSVEVPQTWSRDVATCGTPTEDTLLTYQFARLCHVRPVDGVESVRIVTTDPLRSSGIDDVLDGVAIRREAGSCEQSIDGMCQSTIWVPSQRVGLLVTSAGDMAAVDAIMATARIDHATAAIPAPYRLGSGLALRIDDYEQRLADLGLVLRLPPGADVGTQPFVDGTGVAVGDVVAVGTSVQVGLASGP